METRQITIESQQNAAYKYTLIPEKGEAVSVHWFNLDGVRVIDFSGQLSIRGRFVVEFHDSPGTKNKENCHTGCWIEDLS